MRQSPQAEAEIGKQGLGWLKSLALLPVPVFVVLIIYFAYINPGTVYEPPYLLPVLNIIFTTIIPFSIAYLAWLSYTKSGQWRLFFIGCGTVAFGLGSLVAGFAINVPGGVNLSVAVYNTGALVAAALISVAAILSLTKSARHESRRSHALYLGLYYMAVSAFMLLFTIGVYAGLVPPFFVQGTGPTLLRQLVLGTAAALFAFSSIIFLIGYSRSRSDFTYWFSIALILIATGLVSVLLQKSVGGPGGWTGRAAQYMGCAYMLVGIVVLYRIANIKRAPLEMEFARSFNFIEANYRTLVEMAGDAIISVDNKGTILSWNPAAVGIFGYPVSQAVGANVIDFIFPRESALLLNGEMQKLAKAGRRTADPGNKIEIIARREKGDEFPAEVSMALKMVAGEWLGTFIVRDITGRKEAEAGLRDSEERFAMAFSMNPDPTAITVPETGQYLDVNPAFEKWSGYSRHEIIGNTSRELNVWVNPADRDTFLNRLRSQQPAEDMEITFRVRSGETRDTLFTARTAMIGGRELLLTRAHDVTERRHTEESILRSKVLLQSVIDSTPDWMYVKDFQHKFLLVNKSFAGAQNLTPQDMIGRPDTDFFPAELCLGDPERGISGFHADDNQAFKGKMVHNPKNVVTWADGSMHIYDSYKIPLADQSGEIYAALVYSRDMTEQRVAEEEREASYHAIQKTLHDVINTMAKIVEMRDPYTSGHQGRVARLAGAIAREMNWADARVEHLMMAASIHDVGKMYVPADILSKPGKLLDIEWAMIKTHVQGSYEILKDLEFSQPIAVMALQHHERLDGSGYPNGLKGDEMLLESKILAVADVVEAMSSHRPYRPALGIEKALEEISVNRGKLYDAEVVDLCITLFKRDGFQFAE